MSDLILYSTADCHLCEQALQLLREDVFYAEQGLQCEVVDIADDDALIETYGIRIPVLRVGDAELGWPFDAGKLNRFLRARCAAAL